MTDVTAELPRPPRGMAGRNWWRNLGSAQAPGYYIPVNNGGRLKIVPGLPNPHGVWLVVNNRIILNGNKIANRTKPVGVPPRTKTLFQAWQNGNRVNALTMIQNLRQLKMNQRVAVKQMIHEIIRERKAAMKNKNWKVRVGAARANANTNAKHQKTIDFWTWIASQINTGRGASPSGLRAPRTSRSPVASRTRSRGRSSARRPSPPNAWNAN